jgi:hypothetical protein
LDVREAIFQPIHCTIRPALCNIGKVFLILAPIAKKPRLRHTCIIQIPKFFGYTSSVY